MQIQIQMQMQLQMQMQKQMEIQMQMQNTDTNANANANANTNTWNCRSHQSCCPGNAPQFALLVRHDTTTSMRPFEHSTGQLLWTDVGLSTTRQEGAATRICASVHSREHH